jgi:hypothetical protein
MTKKLDRHDADHLKILSIFHLVVGAMMMVLYSFPLIHVFIGAMIVSGDMGEAAGPGAGMGWFFILIGSVFVLGGWAIGATIIYAGRCLHARKRWTFCLVAGCLAMLFMPFGTVLGIFTVIVLMRESVKDSFARKEILGGL